MGLVSAMLGVGGGIGVVISGLIADHASWRLLFVVGAAVGLVALALAWRFVPPSPNRSPSRPDRVGAALLLNAVSPTETGIATGMNTVVRTVGGVIGAQIGASLLAAMTVGPTDVPAESAFVTAFWLAAIAAIIGAGLTAAIHRRARAIALAREEMAAAG